MDLKSEWDLKSHLDLTPHSEILLLPQHDSCSCLHVRSMVCLWWSSGRNISI